MPNGGVPMHLLMRPSGSGSHVIFCQGAQLKIIPSDQWETAKRDGRAAITLDEAESQVLSRFLRYWLQDEGEGPIYAKPGVDVVYDF